MVSSYTNFVGKDDFNLNVGDFNKLKNAQQMNKLYSQEYNENERLKVLKKNKNIYNLSFNTLLQNFSTVLMEILNDTSSFINSKNKSINSFMIIFVKKERLMYIGMLLLIISLALWFIDISK